MNLQQLYYFLTIVQKRNYTRASEQLRVTQSTLSHSINDLERELNAPLFIRSGRSIRLTRFGEILLEHVEPALELLEEAKAKLKDMTDPESGMVSISMPLVNRALNSGMATAPVGPRMGSFS